MGRDNALERLAVANIGAEPDRPPLAAGMAWSASGAPACQIQISEASTRCQRERSPAASRKRIALAAPLSPVPGRSRHSSR
jgi:hypothetical protein